MSEYKRVLGLDIGSNSIGFCLLDLKENNKETIYNEIQSNSIIFKDPILAKDRRIGRGSRNGNTRKGSRKKNIRRLYIKYGLANIDFLEDTTEYLNKVSTNTKDVYSIRQKAVQDKNILTKEEFLHSTYSIITRRNYNDMFNNISNSKDDDNEDGVIKEEISKNRKEYEESNYAIPTMLLTKKREILSKEYQNIPVRNKRDDYINSLDRDLCKEEFKKVVKSQINNKSIFITQAKAEEFLKEVCDVAFYQRDLKSFEDMVEYCSFYNKFHPQYQEKRVPRANSKNIELTLRKVLANYEIKNTKTGELITLNKSQIDEIIDFWIIKPTSNTVTVKNICKVLKLKNLEIANYNNSDNNILDITAHRNILKILKEYDIDFRDKDSDFYDDILLKLYYFKNDTSREKEIKKVCEKYKKDLSIKFLFDIKNLQNMDGFGAFSLKFINEILEKMNTNNLSYDKSLEELGYFSKYINMQPYNYLPPLNPTIKDIKWLENNISDFKKEELFYQPLIPKKVKRVISGLRRLVNELIKNYGKIDEIRIETSKDLNNEKEKDKIKKVNSKNRAISKEAEDYIIEHNLENSSINIEKVKLFKEQKGICIYSGKTISTDDLKTNTQIDHFIPRSTIYINSFKNKVLVLTNQNQNKGSQNPISYLRSIGQWENFKQRVEKSTINENKKEWLTNIEKIEQVLKKDNWKDSFLNDTRTATKTIQKYLNHYLYPSKNLYRKDEKRSIYSVTGKAVYELKKIWGINNIMPKDDKGQKDRTTNYHHTIDAFSTALCSSNSITVLHSLFKQNENRFKIKAQLKNISSTIPKTQQGMNINKNLQNIIKLYEENEKYVYPYYKRKINQKGFKDTNYKLYVEKESKDKSKNILKTIDKINIDPKDILFETKGERKIERSNEEIKEYIKELQSQLNPTKQKNIIASLDIYTKELIETKEKISTIEEKIKKENNQKKINEDKKTSNEIIQLLKNQKDDLYKYQNKLRCSFKTKNGTKQIVRSLKIRKKEEIVSASIIYPKRKGNKNKDTIEQLSLEKYQKAILNKEPFVVKKNKSTIFVDIFKHSKQGQVIGLNYFNSIKNNIPPSINPKFQDEIKPTTKSEFRIFKNDIIRIDKKDKKLNTIDTQYYLFNGGGNISGGMNTIKVKLINKIDKIIKSITLNKNTVLSKAKIDFFGNICSN